MQSRETDSPKPSKGDVLAPSPDIVDLDIQHLPVLHEDLIRPRAEVTGVGNEVAEEDRRDVFRLAKESRDLRGL